MEMDNHPVKIIPVQGLLFSGWSASFLSPSTLKTARFGSVSAPVHWAMLAIIAEMGVLLADTTVSARCVAAISSLRNV
jgi:hypothetical protein